jgi:hypothetical protein
MPKDSLSPARRFVRPRSGDTFEAIAARELGGQPREEAVSSLRAWNPHLALRRGEVVLVSDVVFLEP